MILSIKSVTGQNIKISVNESDTFADLKARIHEEHKVDVDIKSLGIEGRLVEEYINVFNYYQFKKDEELNIKSQICRLCGEVHLVNSMIDIKQLKDKLHILQLKVNAGVLSNLACTSCVEKLKDLINFIESFWKAEKKQLEIIQSHRDACPFCTEASNVEFVSLSDYLESKKRHKMFCLKGETFGSSKINNGVGSVISVKTEIRTYENFNCELCSKTFRSKKRLEFHIEFHLQGSSAGQCGLCKKEFSSEMHFYKHMKHNHLNRKFHTCEACGKSFRNKSSLTYHLRSHDSYEAMKSYPCELCNKRFVRKNILMDHMRARHGIEADTQPNTCFQCPLCKELFPDTSSGISHMEIQHHDHIDDKMGYSFNMQTVYKIYVCEFCDKCYSLPDDLMEHRSRHSEPFKHQCKMCNEEFKSIMEMRNHLDDHKSDGMKDYKEQFEVPLYYVCEFCQKCFINFHAFHLHRKTHSGPQPYICRFCCNTFRSYFELKQHVTTHVGGEIRRTLRPFECQICRKLFTSNSSLTKHLRVHTGEKPFQCQVCSKAFAQTSGLYTHYKVHSDDRPYKCGFCTKSFKRIGDHKAHGKVHSGVKLLGCDLCSKSFSSQRTLKQHVKNH